MSYITASVKLNTQHKAFCMSVLSPNDDSGRTTHGVFFHGLNSSSYMLDTETNIWKNLDDIL